MAALVCLCGISLWAGPGEAGWQRHLDHMRRFEQAPHTPAFWAAYQGE